MIRRLQKNTTSKFKTSACLPSSASIGRACLRRGSNKGRNPITAHGNSYTARQWTPDRSDAAKTTQGVYDIVHSTGRSLDASTRDEMEQRFSHSFSQVPLHSGNPNGMARNLTVGPPDSMLEHQAVSSADALMTSSQLKNNNPHGAAVENMRFDFGKIRIHDDPTAAESAQALNANAYTVGNHVVFGTGQYAPHTTHGRRLIAHELTHVVQQTGNSGTQNAHKFRRPAGGLIQRDATARPTSENVWGLRVTRRMCGCRPQVHDMIDWANTAAATYAACDVPANTTGTDVEACFDAAHPGTTTAGSTSPSGTMTLPPVSSDPCERIENKATFVHETMHARHTEAIARAQGTPFFREWRRLAGDPNRLDTLRASFPAQVTAFETQWDNGHDWAQDEVNSYRWERRFLRAALSALNRIC